MQRRTRRLEGDLHIDPPVSAARAPLVASRVAGLYAIAPARRRRAARRLG
ncbi:hypothetical protein SCE1572_41365 [Sorangium cellulosum So0157-2]|uniref:Uncharacterized protein n=1 Tax=Sorangium cellulosum So0157-2 TaxID=1254432 RepID=S4Y6C2_SORCE|nr:hypothetical protein SCE1572_41365 [Sorangium cellulosum So0157-2]